MVRDSIDVAIDLDEKSVYSHVAHESALDLIRIISSIDAERAQLRGEVIYFEDDWDELIRKRIEMGKRHTAFDFYNPALLDLWEDRVKRLKRLKRLFFLLKITTALLTGTSLVFSFFSHYSFIIIPIVLLIYKIGGQTLKERIDLVYYEMAQYFIDEMACLLSKYNLNPSEYRFKLFHWDYQNVKRVRYKGGIFAEVLPKDEDNR